MKIKILRGTVAGGERRKPGDEVDVSDREARFLVNIKKAVPIDKMEVPKDLGTYSVGIKRGKGK